MKTLFLMIKIWCSWSQSSQKSLSSWMKWKKKNSLKFRWRRKLRDIDSLRSKLRLKKCFMRRLKSNLAILKLGKEIWDSTLPLCSKMEKIQRSFIQSSLTSYLDDTWCVILPWMLNFTSIHWATSRTCLRPEEALLKETSMLISPLCMIIDTMSTRQKREFTTRPTLTTLKLSMPMKMIIQIWKFGSLSSF